jgi:hypothetical protein
MLGEGWVGGRCELAHLVAEPCDGEDGVVSVARGRGGGGVEVGKRQVGRARKRPPGLPCGWRKRRPRY